MFSLSRAAAAAVLYIYNFFSSRLFILALVALFISAGAVNFRSVRIRYISGDGVGVRVLKIYLFRWLLLSVVDYIAQARSLSLSFVLKHYIYSTILYVSCRV